MSKHWLHWSPCGHGKTCHFEGKGKQNSQGYYVCIVCGKMFKKKEIDDYGK